MQDGDLCPHHCITQLWLSGNAHSTCLVISPKHWFLSHGLTPFQVKWGVSVKGVMLGWPPTQPLLHTHGLVRECTSGGTGNVWLQGWALLSSLEPVILSHFKVWRRKSGFKMLLHWKPPQAWTILNYLHLPLFSSHKPYTAGSTGIWSIFWVQPLPFVTSGCSQTLHLPQTPHHPRHFQVQSTAMCHCDIL